MQVPTLKDEEIIDTPELARRISATVRTVADMRSKGQIPTIKFNKRCFRYRWSHVLAALEKIEVKAS